MGKKQLVLAGTALAFALASEEYRETLRAIEKGQRLGIAPTIAHDADEAAAREVEGRQLAEHLGTSHWSDEIERGNRGERVAMDDEELRDAAIDAGMSVEEYLERLAMEAERDEATDNVAASDSADFVDAMSVSQMIGDDDELYEPDVVPSVRQRKFRGRRGGRGPGNLINATVAAAAPKVLKDRKLADKVIKAIGIKALGPCHNKGQCPICVAGVRHTDPKAGEIIRRIEAGERFSRGQILRMLRPAHAV